MPTETPLHRLSPNFVDVAFAGRLERVEGVVGRGFVEARAHLDPRTSAASFEAAGTIAIFDGPDSPMTQTFGLGMAGEVADAELHALEAFFASRGAPTQHEVCPLAGVETYERLARLSYRPVELSNVLVCAPGDASVAAPDPAILVRVAGASEADLWIETALRGWTQDADAIPMLRDIFAVAFANRSMTHFFAEIDGVPVATGGLASHAGIALLAGASTVPSARNRGAQRALLSTRLELARRLGCDAVMMATLPGSTSQRNAERVGFRVAYSRTKWGKPVG